MVGEDGSTWRITPASPRVLWVFNDFSVYLPQWLATLCSGRCISCNKGSLWYMFQGWGTVATRVDLKHRDSKMELVVHAKLCGWCRRQVRRDTRERNPELVEAAEWDQAAFNRLARCEETSKIAAGVELFFPAGHYMVTHIWVHQTNRYVDYPALERFNFE